MKDNKAFINEFSLNIDVINKIYENNHEINIINNLIIGDLSFHIKELLTKEEISLINIELDKQEWIPVGRDGIKNNYKKNDKIGSYRLSCYEPKLADAIWNRIKINLPKIRIMKELTPTDWDEHKEWKPIGINPLFRFIRYNQDGLLVPHYDASFIKNEEIKSLSSFIIYLSDNDNGATRFLKDKQVNLPLKERNYADWQVEAHEDLVLFKINPSKGDALLFDHRILHDSEVIKENEIKIIMRTDIMYKKIQIN